jgi:hypothetical protein
MICHCNFIPVMSLLIAHLENLIQKTMDTRGLRLDYNEITNNLMK